MPPVLRGRIGRHAAREWAKLANSIAVKRDIIREVLSIELLRTDSDNRKFGPHRLRLAWTYGETAPPPAPAKPAKTTTTGRARPAAKSAASKAPPQRRPAASPLARTAGPTRIAG